jgi:hypothetical protein
MARYITVPIDKDPETVFASMVAYIQTKFPSWQPRDGNLATVLMEALSIEGADCRTLASKVPDTIYRTLGTTLFNLPPDDAVSAQAATTWTAKDNAGYTVLAGTQVGVRNSTGELIPFVVIDDVIILAGATATAAGGVQIQAVTPGVLANTLGSPGGPVELIDPIEWVTGITIVAPTSGGVDAELNDAYLGRLATTIQIMTLTPILPGDFAILAREVAGVYRATAIDLYNPGTNERQQVAVNATGGTFTLTYSGQTTAAIAFNADAATVKTRLIALSNIDHADVSVSGGPLPGTPILVEFTGLLAHTNVAQMTADSTLLTGGTHTATITTVLGGAADVTTEERAIAVASQDSNGNPVSDAVDAAVDAWLESLREVNFNVYTFKPVMNTVDVTFTVTLLPGFLEADVIAAAESAVSDYLNAARWGTKNNDPLTWTNDPTIRYLELATVLNNVQGIDTVDTLTIGFAGGAQTAADHTMVGKVPLPIAGAIVGSAT